MPNLKIHKLIDSDTGQAVHLVYAIPPGFLNGITPEGDSIGLHDLIARMWRGRLWIIGGSVLGALLGWVIALSKPDFYTSKVVALPPPEKGPDANLAQFAGMAAMAGIALPKSEGTSKDALVAILNSRTLHECIIEQYQLAGYYKSVDSRDRTLKAFRKDWSVKAPKTSATITFGFTHTDPQIVADVANRGAELLHELFTTMQQGEAARERIFLEQRLNQAEGDWQKAADAMASFMLEHKAVQIEAQTEATVAALGTLQGQLIAQQIELNAQRAVRSGEENPLLRLLVERIHGMEGEIARLQGPGAGGALIGLAALPAIGQEYLVLMREGKRQEALLSGLIAQVEIAKLNEAREMRVIATIDVALVPDMKSGPQRAFQCGAFTLFGGLLGVLAAVFSPVWRRITSSSF